MPERRQAVQEAIRRIAGRTRGSMHAPAIDVEQIAGTAADVRSTPLPTRHAALATVHQEARAVICLDPARAGTPLRRRAALAHALGHILLPWHAGCTGCELADGASGEPAAGTGSRLEWQEYEADMWARELLIPDQWLRGNLDAGRPVATARDVRRHCDVPIGMAAAAVASMLPAGHAWAVTVQGYVRRSGTSRGTRHATPSLGESVTAHAIARTSREHQILELDDRTLHWWILDDPSSRSAAIEFSGSGSRDVLRQILDDIGVHGGAATQVRDQVASIVGWAVGERPAGTGDELMELVLARRSNLDHTVVDAIDHPEFPRYVIARAARR